MIPNFLIVGAARCGTSYIAKNLAFHPEIYIPEEKELHFFDKNYDKGIDYYRTLFVKKNSTVASVVGEATPAYLYDPKVPSLIKKHLPEVKIIAILRDPIERTYSHYWNMVAKDKSFKNSSFEEKLAEFPRLIEESKYYDKVKRYYELFPRDNILILFFEELLNNATGEFKKIYDFLKVDSSFESPLLTHKINSSGNKNGQSKFLYFSYKLFFKLIKAPALANFIEKINSREAPKMNDTTRKALEAEFYSSNKELEILLEKDLGIWT